MNTDQPTLDSSPLPPTRHVPEFNGKAGEFFGIWIVNVLLTVVTLGIYSAWAKVRTHRYFYSNTRLAGSSFEYLAPPLKILKGRLIAYAFMIAFGLSAKFQIFYLLIPLYLLILVCFPGLIFLGLRFRARYSAWRGIRFRFDGTLGDAYMNFMLLPIVSVFTLNMLSPWVHMQQQSYMIKGHRFGGKTFGFEGDVGKYYIPFFIALGLGMALGIVFFMSMLAVTAVIGGTGGKADPDAIMPVMIPLIVLLYAGFFTIPIFLRARYTNLMWQNARLGAHRFESTIRARDMIWIYFSNAIAIVCTLGLAVPWAMVRMAKYRFAHFGLLASGSIDDFIVEAAGEQGAAGAELASALDMDVDVSL
jgi:uncharacterized membrane protein YjgN (DUF898 family)